MQEKKYKLYEDVLKNGVLITTSKLEELDLDDNDIQKLIADNILINIEENLYQFNNYSALYNYSKYFLHNRDYGKTEYILVNAAKLFPNELAYANALMATIGNNNYNQAFFYLNKFKEKDDYISTTKYDIIAYLLSFLTELPNEYDHIKYMTENDFYWVEKSECLVQDICTSIQHKLYLQTFQDAKDLVSKYIDYLYNNEQKPSTYYNILNILLPQVIYNNNHEENFLAYLALEKDYEGILDEIESMERNHRVTHHILTIKCLVNDILEIEKTGSYYVPKEEFHDNQCYKAVLNYEYDYARKMRREKNQKCLVKYQNDPILILLDEIVDMINNLDKKWKLDSIDANLLEGNYDLYYDDLKDYLKDIEMDKYIPIFPKLVKISLQEKDPEYLVPTKFLDIVESKDDSIIINCLINLLEESIYYQQFDSAVTYLDIIINLDRENENFDYKEIYEGYAKTIYEKIDEGVEELGKIDRKYFKIIEDIVNIIEIENISVEQWCQKYNLNKEIESVIYISFAKRHYSKGDISNGNKYLSIVEKGENTPFVNMYLQEVRKNKKIYANNPDSITKIPEAIYKKEKIKGNITYK